MDTVTVTLVSKCTCDEWVMCPTHEAMNDAVVAGQDMYVTMMDDAGISRITRQYRAYRAEARASGTLEADLERFAEFSAMQCARPETCPIDPMARRWNRTRVSRSAPADALLTMSPVAITERTKIEW